MQALLRDLMYILIFTSCSVFFLNGQLKIAANIILASISKSDNIYVSEGKEFVDIFIELSPIRKFSYRYSQQLSIINSFFLATFTLLTLVIRFVYDINTFAFALTCFALSIINIYQVYSCTRLLKEIYEEMDKFLKL